MAFCDNCGAYIPDGQTACLACGFDGAEKERIEREKAAQAEAAAAAAAQAESEKSAAGTDTGKYYSFTNEELRQKLEEQRRRQQETSRKWAEQEKARRQAAADKGTVPGETFRSTGEKAEKAVKSFAKNSRLLAALSYLGILFVLPFLVNKDDHFSVYHAKQGGILFLYGILSRVLRFIPIVGMVLRLFYFYCIYKGMSNALNEIKQPLPYIGQLGDRF